MLKLKKIEHFPKIFIDKTIKNEHLITIPYYEREKIKFDENIWFVKNYVKSLLLSIKKLNDIGYVHGDVKPENFIYINPNYYYLIDFNGSGKIGKKNENKKIASFPYMPPEKNIFTGFFNDNISNKESDLWSVGIILLQFITKNNIKFLKKGNNCEEKSLFQYSKLYGSNISKIKIEKKIQFNKELDIFRPNVINKNYKREEIEKKNTIDLIKKLLQIDANERITVDDALNNDFFINEIDKDYCEFCLNIAKDKTLRDNKYEMIEKFKICVICNKKKENKKIMKCKNCDNFFHFECSKNNQCSCKKNLNDSDFIKKINNCIFINENINKKYFRKKNLNLKLPNNGEENSIISILNEIGLNFSNELVYECDENLNYYLMEYGIFELYEKDIEIYNQVKEMNKKGKYNYIKIDKNNEQGYLVKANTFIKENTLICEYAGDVLTFKDFCNKKIENDSNMDLIITPQSETSLIICPNKHSNIARFISGINNLINFENMVNVFSAKVAINGIVHILLIALKDIKKDYILYYNYNAATNKYPTNNFVYQKK